MKGSPFQEWLLVCGLALLCLFPAFRLTRSVSAPQPHDHSTHAHTHAPSTESAWLEIRSSHPPELIQVFQDSDLLWEGREDPGLEGDFELRVSEGRSTLEILFRYPEEVEQAYAEIRLEAGARPGLERGYWISGEERRIWHLEWEEAL